LAGNIEERFPIWKPQATAFFDSPNDAAEVVNRDAGADSLPRREKSNQIRELNAVCITGN
jgi:hypothetical protein